MRVERFDSPALELLIDDLVHGDVVVVRYLLLHRYAPRPETVFGQVSGRFGGTGTHLTGRDTRELSVFGAPATLGTPPDRPLFAALLEVVKRPSELLLPVVGTCDTRLPDLVVGLLQFAR